MGRVEKPVERPLLANSAKARFHTLAAQGLAEGRPGPCLRGAATGLFEAPASGHGNMGCATTRKPPVISREHTPIERDGTQPRARNLVGVGLTLWTGRS
jgi:hypothetical protein